MRNSLWVLAGLVVLSAILLRRRAVRSAPGWTWETTATDVPVWS